jgi:hypothetical protein
MYNKDLFYILVFSLICVPFVQAQAVQTDQYKVQFDKRDFTSDKNFVVIDDKKIQKSTLIKQFQTQIGIANKELKEQMQKKHQNQKSLSITSINVIKDCTASVNCGGGQTVSCSIRGPGTCESGTHSVACITSNQAETKVCDSP